MVGASRAQGEQSAENKCSKSKDEKKLSMGWAGVFRTTWEYGWRQEAAAAWGKVPEGLLRVDLRDFSGGPVVKNLLCSAGDAGSIPG